MGDPYEVKKVIPLSESEVLVIPATEEKRASLKWLTSITVSTPSPKEEGRFVLEYRPMTELGEIVYNDAEGKDTTRVISVNNLYELKKEIPELAAAFAAVLSCVNPIESKVKKSFQDPDPHAPE